MPRKMKDEEFDSKDWKAMKKKKKMKMGWLLLILGIILYAKEIGLIPYAGSIWTLAMMLVGIVMIVMSMM